jgi:hypothetical protein
LQSIDKSTIFSFVVVRGANGRLVYPLAGTTAEIMTKACASGQSSVIERSILAS